jgi:hypothetical protein
MPLYDAKNRTPMTIRRLWLGLAILIPALIWGQAARTTITFNLPAMGVLSATTSASGDTLRVGYSTLSTISAYAMTGLAIFGFRQNGVLVTEAATLINPGFSSGSFYVRAEGNINTGIAMSNADGGQTVVQYSLIDRNGDVAKTGSFTIAPRGQIATFLTESPFDVVAPFEGSFSFTSSTSIFVVPLRTLLNERGDFLLTTLPVSDPRMFETGYVIPQFADGGGWTTEVLLVNPGDTTLAGTVQWTDPLGAPTSLTVNGQRGSSFPFSLPAKSATRFDTAGDGTDTKTGVVSVFGATSGGIGPPVTPAPLTGIVFRYRRNGITVTETGAAPSVFPSGKTAYFYAEAVGNWQNPADLPRQTAIAILNARSQGPIPVSVQLTRLDGTVAAIGSLTLKSAERKSLFLTEIPGLESLELPFRGMAVITAPDSLGLYVLSVRATYNERGDFLLSTTPVILTHSQSPLFPVPWSGTVFPHFASGAGYSTQFVLFSSQFVDENGQPGPATSGTLRFFEQNGNPLGLTFE